VHLFGAYNVPLDPARYASTETLTLDQLEVKTIQSGAVDYVILSDATLFFRQRSWEIIPQLYLQDLSDRVRLLDNEFTRIAQIERPVWPGYDWMTNNASYWHNPGLIVYCVTEESCSAVR
jgi:hypothetical protein